MGLIRNIKIGLAFGCIILEEIPGIHNKIQNAHIQQQKNNKHVR